MQLWTDDTKFEQMTLTTKQSMSSTLSLSLCISQGNSSEESWGQDPPEKVSGCSSDGHDSRPASTVRQLK